MTVNEKNKNESLKKPNISNFVKIFIALIILAFLGSIFFPVERLEKISTMFGNQTVKQQESIKNEPQSKTDVKGSDIIQPKEELDLTKNTDTEEIENKKEVSDSDDSKENIVKNSKNSFSKKETNITLENYNLVEYRMYLADMNKMIVKFLENKTYSKELEGVVQEDIKLPNRIEKIISMLSEYNNNLIGLESLNEEIQFNSKLVNKYLRVRKSSDQTLNQENLRKEIKNNIDDLIEFIFSSKLQKSFLLK